jgi:DNA repair photolyase
LRANDIETGINVMPVLPAITDGDEQLDTLVRSVGEHGASYVNACALRLRSSARARYLPFIEKEFPHLARRYHATYAFDHRVSAQYSESLRTKMRAICERYGVAYGHNGRSEQDEVYDEVTAQRFAGEQLSFEWASPSSG